MKAQEKLGKTCTIRSSPKATAGSVGSVAPYATVDYTDIVADQQYPTNSAYLWLKLANGYVAYMYPPNGERFTLIPEVPTGPQLVHTIEVYSDGSLVIDGNPYP